LPTVQPGAKLLSSDIDRLLAGIRDGNYHAGGIRCLRLFALERRLALALRADVDRICESESGSDVQDRRHVTHWTGPTGTVTQYSLLNRSGDFADFHTDHDLSCRGKRFHHGVRYPRLDHFIAQFPHAVNFRISVLGPNAALAAHEEHSIFRSEAGTPAIRARFHVPIRTKRQASMTLDGQVFRFLPQVLYYFNQGCVHDAANMGACARIHLVWDMLLTQQTFDLMFGDARPPDGLRRIPPAGRTVRPVGHTTVDSYASLPPLIAPLEARRLTISPVQ
jgi:hypothetical protein